MRYSMVGNVSNVGISKFGFWHVEIEFWYLRCPPFEGGFGDWGHPFMDVSIAQLQLRIIQFMLLFTAGNQPAQLGLVVHQ